MKKENVEILDTIFLNVNEWLKFAESKNAVLITLVGASIFALAETSDKFGFCNQFFSRLYLINIFVFMILSFLVSLCSFLPQVKLFWLWPEKKATATPNILFYSDLARLSPEELINTIYDTDIDKSNKEYLFKVNFAEQIINNSKIAQRKYNYFRVSVWLVLSGILTPLIGGILYIVIDPNSWYSKQ